MTRARELSKLSNQQTLKIDTTNTRIGIGSTAPSASLDVGQNIYADANSGVLTATKYAGDGSLLTGVTGLGTALSSSGVLSNLFYVNTTFNITEDTTITVPATSTSNVAYTTKEYNFNVGLIIINNSEIEDKKELIQLYPSEDWKKIYLDLGPLISMGNIFSKFKIYFEGYYHNTEINNAVYIDNIKLISSE